MSSSPCRDAAGKDHFFSEPQFATASTMRGPSRRWTSIASAMSFQLPWAEGTESVAVAQATRAFRADQDLARLGKIGKPRPQVRRRSLRPNTPIASPKPLESGGIRRQRARS